MIIEELICQISSGTYDERLMDIYVDNNKWIAGWISLDFAERIS